MKIIASPRNIIAAMLLSATMTSLSASEPVMIGRRGCGYAVENTAEAYLEGARRGFTMMEAHVRATADSVFVTSHDGKTDRLGGHMKIASSIIADLRNEAYTQQRDSATYRAKGICTVGEFLDICADKGVAPLLHLKTFSKDTKDCGHLSPLVSLIREKGMAGKCVILTSEPDYIDYLMANHPEIKLQFQADAKWKEMFDWSNSRRLDVQIRADLVDADCVRRYHDAGVKVNVWTVNTSEDYTRLRNLGVDYIVTDYLSPEALPLITN
ncbi:MAG: glycerophosphodiester phosphodiesterase [Duncaniella sp.]|nr:glycerophosphodiester phosphodiesterase [Duncaniella sp.]